MAETPHPVIIIDDEKHLRISLGQTLELAGYQVQSYESAELALRALSPEWPGVVISDIRMPGMDGMTFLQQAHALDTDLPVILITGHGDISTAVAAIRQGAYDFLEKPFRNEILLDVVARALDKRRLTLENRSLKEELARHTTPGPRVLGRTQAMQKVMSLANQIARVETDLLLWGETGAGKDMLARYIHEQSSRAGRNFVAINCGAVPESIIESELFGHEPGAFTGANKRRVGKFEHADGGTVFLDEIESMPLNLQVKLLRVLQERQLERLGSNTPVSLDIRIIAATKTDLKQAAAEGLFREDLYYRLNVVTLEIPPLRERREDIPLLFQHFAIVAATRSGLEAPTPTPAQSSMLMSHDWPGNVRELRNLAERYVLLGATCDYDLEQLMFGNSGKQALTLPEQVEMFEKSLIEQALARNKGSIKNTLEDLCLPRKTLYDKLKKYGLSREDFLAED
ncbi:sigma-54-dependent transcriptional regulator [Marinospirillum alkaliphilum]|uniref:Two-component system, NtrC family, C4-dicarboxylate transport response regulator DctD n=1 Tax=Marinospirillum alkaliphilum DSM 21637 TaxID=1122209 RepID=A0A1K1ZWS6_9GAMM|nr:sigma-54 dependent transcriptional regulator [Marinospirillum alkaliphilum]SFX78714.1 two-component system, NtrC family, C4-dicarboxylate transport response regulator DctD [Marinospirillum alkaliphilum DSM 21637]